MRHIVPQAVTSRTAALPCEGTSVGFGDLGEGSQMPRDLGFDYVLMFINATFLSMSRPMRVLSHRRPRPALPSMVATSMSALHQSVRI